MNLNDDSSIKFTPREGAYRSASGSSTKPTGEPRGDKSFKRILADREDQESDQEVGIDPDEPGKDLKTEQVRSPFELSAERKQPLVKHNVDQPVPVSKEELALVEGEDLIQQAQVVPEKPQVPQKSEVQEAASQAEKPSLVSPEQLMASAQQNKPVSPEGKPVSREQSPGQSLEHPAGQRAEVAGRQGAKSPEEPITDLDPDQSKGADWEQAEPPPVKKGESDVATFSQPVHAPQVEVTPAVNLLSGVTAAEAVTPASDAPVQRAAGISADLQVLVDRMAREITVIKDQGLTETAVELKYPPLFDGARLVVTSTDTARGEFNVKFENLTQAAQQVLDAQGYRADLLNTLEQRGYHVHIFTTTTYEERPIITANADNPQRERGDDQQQQQQQRQQQGRQGRQQPER